MMKRQIVSAICLSALIAMCATALAAEKFKLTAPIPEGLTTPDTVETTDAYCQIGWVK